MGLNMDPVSDAGVSARGKPLPFEEADDSVSHSSPEVEELLEPELPKRPWRLWVMNFSAKVGVAVRGGGVKRPRLGPRWRRCSKMLCNSPARPGVF